MALSSTTLANLIKSKLLADATTHAVDNAALDAFCRCIAEAVIEHLTAAATVTLNPGAVAVGAMGGGPGVPVTGTGTIA